MFMDFTLFNPNGYDYISNLICTAIANGNRTATINGNWIIDKAIKIPSNFTLVLDGCHLVLADGCYLNVFVNQNHDTEIGKTIDGRDKNIAILGINSPIIDGGNYNGLSEKNQKEKNIPIWKNNLILFTNVENFTISGINFRNQRWWAINFVYCSNGTLKNLDFCACDIGIDANGNKYHGLNIDKYDEVLVKNADGIDLRQGCHDILIENITGFTEDDTIALTGLCGQLEKTFSVEGLCSDICNIKIKNVRSTAFCTIVRLLNQSGVKLHDIEIDGVFDTCKTSTHVVGGGLYAVRVGDNHLYGTRHSTPDETYNISIKNVVGNGRCVLSLAGATSNLTYENLSTQYDTPIIIDDRTESI